MNDLFSSKDLLPNDWWAVADCVDAYEAESGDSFPPLKKYADRAQPEFRAAALAELVKVDLERRWTAGDRRRTEDYLREYPELECGDFLPEIVQQEYFLRSRNGETPSAGELSSRFPSLDQRRVLHTDEYLLNTIAFGHSPDETQEFAPGAAATNNPAAVDANVDFDRTGTVMFDSKKLGDSAGGSTAGAKSLNASELARAETAGAPLSTAASRSATPAIASPSAKPPSLPPLRDAATIGESTLTPPVKPKELIGRYSIKRTLGSGSFGMVYQCFDEGLKREVAIKVPHGANSNSAARVKEFMHEAQSAARLKHPGIVSVMDTSQTPDGRVFIVYEFIPGSTLQNKFEEGTYSLEDAARWIAEVAEALNHAHQQNIIHRDIKPANVLVDAEGKTHIADFGLAKLDDQFFKNDAGRVLGTVAYMSPEQAAGQSHWATPQTDIYALGVMLYQFLTRRLPFASASSATEALDQIQHRVPPPPRTVNESIPPALEEVCLKAMAKSPADRYRTAGDMAVDLQKAIAPAVPPTRRGFWIAVAAGGAAAVVALTAFFATRDRGNSANGTTSPISQENVESIAKASAQAAVAKVVQKFDDQSLTLSVGTPTLEVFYQPHDDQGSKYRLRYHSQVPHEGDGVKFEVTTAGDEPRYIYLYWYDVDGKPQRLWPKDKGKDTDVDHQEKLSHLWEPAEKNKWWGIDASRGAETALAFVRDEPLSRAELAEFEKNRPYGAGEVQNKHVYPFSSDELQTERRRDEKTRGLTTIIESRDSPLSPEFEALLKEKFAAYDGMVVPHQ
ncbi:MAG TPA: protein kinase [Pirellulales bacterium]|jgi:serine/threonine protein kinase